ncbi:hypothetical protein D3C73_1289700 [compost metagenome]
MIDDTFGPLGNLHHMTGPIAHCKLSALRLRVISGRDPGLLAETAAEIILIGEADQPGDFPQRLR